MGIWSRSNEGRGLGTGRDLEETEVRGKRGTIIVTRGANTSKASYEADIATARRHLDR